MTLQPVYPQARSAYLMPDSVTLSTWRCTSESQQHESASTEIDINPLYFREKTCEIPRFKLPEHGVLPRTALQIVRDELILDGNARLNLATFVTTWMEPRPRR